MSDSLIKKVPGFLRKSETFKEVFSSEEVQIKAIESNLEDIRLQMDVDTATWGLDIFEKELNIPTDKNKPYSERRSVIKSKLRGSGKVDASLIKIVADSYTNGNVDVSFTGRINIKFNSLLGIPPNITDLQNALDDVKPTHLAIAYEFAYLLIKDINNKMTINELQATQLNKFAGGVY
ncbi:putative phage tail protein [Metabacillus litoralis]|uniref:putative phage tail protein n=1 Tax=Metabacillus litoralis TaxID=152268 RepID=UPI00204016C9|nr:putative phage tail protein [Metabacillus litoralis]MCM3411454.1 YmfQ family protein [Metabacillus litoralis]